VEQPVYKHFYLPEFCGITTILPSIKDKIGDKIKIKINYLKRR